MSDEQLVQEIVEGVLKASIEDREDFDLKSATGNADQSLDEDIPTNLSTHTAVSILSTHTAVSMHNQEEEVKLVDDSKESVEGFAVDEVDGADEKEVKENEELDGDRPSVVMLTHSPQQDENSLLGAADVTGPLEYSDLDLSKENLPEVEVKIESDREDEEAEDGGQDVNLGVGQVEEGVAGKKEFEPITPPAFGSVIRQEEHQLKQHEQQQQLFNASHGEEGIADSDDGGEAQKTNGKETDLGKPNGTSSAVDGPQGKAEPKAKTKLCSIL